MRRVLRLFVAPMLVCGATATAQPMFETIGEAQVRELAVASPYRVSPSARAGTIRYRLAFDAGIEFFVPETGEQRVEISGDEIVVTVCDGCGREAPPTPDELNSYRRPNAWLESEHPTLRGFARAARGGSIDRRMQHLVAAVRERMNGATDYSRYDSALQAHRSHGGDCTEYALLLAAAARARGIPARVVAGVAYGSRFVGLPLAFGPHMWVQAWDGERWVSYDAGLEKFDAGHIALAIGDGAPEAYRGAIRAIRSMRIVDASGLIFEKASAAPH
jgi:transglutaminase-like putative cysteine protease